MADYSIYKRNRKRVRQSVRKSARVLSQRAMKSVSPAVQPADVEGTCSPDKPVGYHGRNISGKCHPRHRHPVFIDPIVQLVADNLSVHDFARGGCRYHSRRCGGDWSHAVAVDAVAVAARAVRGAIERRSDVVCRMQQDSRHQTPTAQEKEEAVHVAHDRR